LGHQVLVGSNCNTVRDTKQYDSAMVNNEEKPNPTVELNTA